MKNVENNLLNLWHKEAFSLSSPLLIKPIIDRNIVQYIYSSLLQFFKLEYFHPSPPDTPIEDINWIHSLLANKENLGCYYALNEICNLLNYYESIKKELPNSMEGAVKDPKILRTFLFELFIYQKLDNAGILNKKKVVRNNQELEGVCQINGREFLFECKKAYYPKLDSLDALVYVLKTFSAKRTMFNNPQGMICFLTVPKPIVKGFKKAFNAYLPTLVNLNNSLSASTPEFSEDLFGGKVTVKLYDEIDFIEAHLQNNYDILFYLKPVSRLDGLRYLYGKSVVNFSQYQSEIFKKLEGILKKVKMQHRPFNGPKIIFIDTEAYPEFRMGLFQTEKSVVITEIDRIINKERFANTIICITRRSIKEGKLVNDVYIYAPPNLNEEGRIAGRMFEQN
ncbi:hypothetical protein [Chitinophaga ginsengisoli]|uniref:Uncharacterized protein n=1 Tax=Chitinophaga ginsengisoli TaxID=363837 RepID=A0A2P8FRY4_9BACT|nr:hypothetical protein [Chitinophaga ginsengisoli]PSL24415.1 hypothetical protein CLV42_1151 [Chitinophaga ginsengisoli]